MKLFILIGQRKQRYEGESGLEALACMTQYDQDANSGYLQEQTNKYKVTHEFEALRVVTLDVDECAVRTVLFPANVPIPASVFNARSFEERSLYACKVCGNVPDEDGLVVHGKGYYTQSAEGGGELYVEFCLRRSVDD